MTADVPPGHVIVGQVGKPFGTGGDVYVFGDADLDEAFDVGTVLHITGGPGGPSATVRRSRWQGDRLIVGLEGVTDRASAEAVRGAVLSRHRDEIALDPDAVWVADLIGRTVVDPAGSTVGTVQRIDDGHAHDLVVIALTGGGSVPVPMVPELIEWTSDPLVVHPIPGLIDDDAL